MRKRRVTNPVVRMETSPDHAMSEEEFDALCDLFAEAILDYEKRRRIPEKSGALPAAIGQNQTNQVD